MKFYSPSSILPNFFVLEGLDGSGKTTLIKELKKKIPEARFDQEPTSSQIGKQLRRFTKIKGKSFRDETLLLLFTADRWEHVFGEKGIASKNREEILFCDRYFFSTMAYQGNSIRTLSYAKKISIPFPLPQIVFYLDIDPELSLSRIKKRGKSCSQYENLERLTKVKKNYDKIFLNFQKKYNLRIIRLDATLDFGWISNQILEALQE